MAQISYRANLSAKSFPFNPFQSARTVIVPGPDNTFNRSVSSAADVDRDVGIPQVIYGHNIMPSQEGFNSNGYLPRITGYTIVTGNPATSVGNPPYLAGGSVSAQNNGVGLRTVYPIEIFGYPGYLAFNHGSVQSNFWVNYRNNPSTTNAAWNKTNTVCYANGGGIGVVSVFMYNSRPYVWIYNPGTGVFELYEFTGSDASTQVMVMTGYSNAAALMLSANGYMIQIVNAGVNGLNIKWTFNKNLWTPSLLTGAGEATILDSKGSARWAAETSFGFIIYCESNAVAAVYTGNAQFPFAFSEIKGSGGFVASSLIASDSNSENQVAWTTAGLQSMNAKTAQNFLPALSDFIKSNLIEDFDTSTLQFSSTKLTQPMNKKLVVVGGRYLVLSYGPYAVSGLLKYALVYDITLARYGKLKRDHYEVYDGNYRIVATDQDDTATGICLLNDTGYVTEVKSDIFTPVNEAASNTTIGPIDSCLFLGKFEYVRSRRLILDKVWAESLQVANAALNTVIDYVSWNGKAFEPGVAGYQYTPENVTAGIGQNSYLFSSEGVNHSLMFIGNWNFTSVQLDFHPGGKI